MGWQKKSSGRRYDSKSGHAFLIGLNTQKIIGVAVYCKSCARCTKAETKNKVAAPHTCPRNYYQSPKSMEADGALLLVTEIFNQYKGKVTISHFLGDDDSTTRARLQKPTRNGKGALPVAYPADIAFWADVNHRVKSMVKGLFSLADLAQGISICTKGDALRIKRNFGYYIQGYRKSTKISLETFIKNAIAPIEHHFHNHEWCDSSWCPFKLMEEHELEGIKRMQEDTNVLLHEEKEEISINSEPIDSQTIHDLHDSFLEDKDEYQPENGYVVPTEEESLVTLEGMELENDIPSFLETYVDYHIDIDSTTFGPRPLPYH